MANGRIYTKRYSSVDEYELLEGVKILNFGPGHAFGMLGLQVDLSNDGTIILASDAINTSVNFGPPVQYPGLTYDARGYEKTIRRIALLKNKYNAQLAIRGVAFQISILS